MSTGTRKIAFCKIGLGFMFYLELQHGPSNVGVEQQTVGSYTGAWITCIVYGDLYRDNSAGKHSCWDLTLSFCLVKRCNTVCLRWLALTALSVAACCRLWVMNWGLMRRHGSSFTSEFIRATRAASLRASAWVSHTWGWRDDEHKGLKCQTECQKMWNFVRQKCQGMLTCVSMNRPCL